jgi:hypothetical protein
MNNNESPGKNDPRIVAVSKNMIAAAPRTAKFPRLLSNT